jgi:hypothetical protein
MMDEPALDAAEIAEDQLQAGMVTWATVDAPWLANVDARKFGDAIAQISSLSPEVILSAHLPVARGVTKTLCRHLDAARSAEPFVGPDQAALMAAAE